MCLMNLKTIPHGINRGKDTNIFQPTKPGDKIILFPTPGKGAGSGVNAFEENSNTRLHDVNVNESRDYARSKAIGCLEGIFRFFDSRKNSSRNCIG